TQAITYFIVNILLAFPLFLLALGKGSSYLLSNLLAFVTVFGLFLLPRLAAAVVFQKSCHFRLNHGGGGLAVWMGLFNNIFPMNANWYPNVYEKTPKLKRRMAIPELVKWVIFLLLPLLPADQSIYFDAVAKLGYVLLIFMIIPVFPF
ncbi:MAG: hypothetical protein PHO41_09690, partial [Eubacteriales bacterium]|nr:hypothetical protein [Eubacteriales bacterium]